MKIAQEAKSGTLRIVEAADEVPVDQAFREQRPLHELERQAWERALSMGRQAVQGAADPATLARRSSSRTAERRTIAGTQLTVLRA